MDEMLHAMLVLTGILEYRTVVAVEPVSFRKESSAYSEQYEPTQLVRNLMKLMCNSSCNVLDHPML